MENEDYIKKWLDGTLNQEEKATFEKTEAYRSLKELSNALMSFQPSEYNAEAGYHALTSRRYVKKGHVITLNRLSPFLKAAAVLLLVTASYLMFLHRSPTVIKTLAAEKREVALPDSSVVVLNALSQLSFDEKRWKTNRRVELEGEAYFNVAIGAKFDVLTSGGTVSVLGTAFNVVNREDYFEVVCYEGLVEVQSQHESVRLSAEGTFRVINGVRKIDYSREKTNLPHWRRGESSFQSVPFRYVILELERQYGVTVTTNNVDTGELFTGTFTHSDLSLALKSISLPLDLSYEVEGKKIILAGDSE